MCRFCSILVQWIVAVIFVVLFIGSLLFAFVGVPAIVKSTVESSVRLDENTDQWDRFKKIPFPFDFKVYVFNVDNADDVFNKGAMPNVTERGPYVYKQTREKEILSMNDYEDTVTYQQTLKFTFSLEDSVGSDEENVTVLNPSMLSVIQGTKEFSKFEKIALNSYLPKIFPTYPLFTQVSVKNLLFDGMEFAKSEGCDFICQQVRTKILGIAGPLKNTDYDKNNDGLLFSFFNYKRREPDGIYTVKRGRDFISTLGSIIRWDNSTETNFWGSNVTTNNETCSKVRGTDSTLYPPDVQKTSHFQIFNTDICRTVEIKYKGLSTYHDIEGYRFETEKTTLRYSTDTPEEDCYCVHSTRGVDGTDDCYLNGVIDMFPCTGVPVLFSFPHFLWADDIYKNGVNGMNAREDAHKTFLIVEPNTGTPLQGIKRIQLNAVLRPEDDIAYTKNLPRTILPLLWLEEGVALTDKYVEELNKMYFDKIKVADIARYTLIGITAIGALASCGFLATTYARRP